MQLYSDLSKGYLSSAYSIHELSRLILYHFPRIEVNDYSLQFVESCESLDSVRHLPQMVSILTHSIGCRKVSSRQLQFKFWQLQVRWVWCESVLGLGLYK